MRQTLLGLFRRDRNIRANYASFDDQAILAQCKLHFTRRGGPGGQHRNKVSTAVVLVHEPTGVTAEANERRSQAENRTVALFRLRMSLALRSRAEPGDAPSEKWRSRVANGKIAINPEHADFPALLAEALDALAAKSCDHGVTAAWLGVTPSQLTKLFKREPRALVLVNDWRQQRGLSRIV